ncbi:MAG TPA: hypothetical protein VN695_00730 [Streptosporangiaceae bacterium]|nr:hypothetical protein [Streptosporangiaceae bacterium]
MPFTAADAVCSDPIGPPSARNAKTVPVVQAAAMDQVRAHGQLTAWLVATHDPVLIDLADHTFRLNDGVLSALE